MAIVDNRTLINAADTTTNWVDSAGSTAGNQNTETFIQGSASVSNKVSAAQTGIMYNLGSATNLSNNHFYIWWNCSTAGKLATEANGGIAIRFAGSTVGNYFEVNVAGADTYSGGFTMSVIDIETAWTSPSEASLTKPATSAIQYVGVIFDVTGMISGNVDNCFVDAMWRLPANTPGMLVEGQNTGPANWTWSDIVNAADSGNTAKAWGTAFKRDGVFFINTPIRFGANDSVTHGFSDTSQVVAWEDQLVASNFYNLEVIGGTGTQSFSLGTRVGSGDTSVGSEGCVITADAAGQRYSVTASDTNIDTADFFGCTFLHASTIDISNANSEMRSTLLSDVSALTHADAGGDGVFQKNTIVNANTADGVAFLTTDNLAEIKNTSFVFSDGHAIELTATGTFTFEGNTFTGYGADGTNDAAIYNNSGGAVTINITGGGDTPTVRNGTGASTTINNAVNLTVTVVDASTNAIQDAVVAMYQTSDDTQLMNELTNASGVATESFNYTTDTAIYVRVRKSTTGSTRYFPVETTGTITSSGFSVTVTMNVDTIAT